MPMYRDRDASGTDREITVIEDVSAVTVDENGTRHPGFCYLDKDTICAHPLIIDVLLADAERLWRAEEIMDAVS